jgi:hypothetical protein
MSAAILIRVARENDEGEVVSMDEKTGGRRVVEFGRRSPR